MLVWRSKSGGVPVVPACLSDWEPRGHNGAQLVHRETDAGHVVGVGDPLVWQPPRKWFDVEDGWQVAMVPGVKFEPRWLVRAQGWADVEEATDMHGRTWLAPKIRSPGGRRAFRVAYGRDWLPALSDEQRRAEEICEAAVNAAGADTPMSVACQWAAELLCMAMHATPIALAVLALVDDVLAVETLRLSASLEIERGAA